MSNQSYKHSTKNILHSITSMDSDDSIYDNFENYTGSGMDDNDEDLIDASYAANQMSHLSIGCNINSNGKLINQENNVKNST